MPESVHVQTIVTEPFSENTYVVWRDKSTDAVVIDPGLQPELILDFLREKSLELKAILNTHGHVDHIGGNDTLKKAYPEAPILIGIGDQKMLTDPMENLSGLFGLPLTSPPADQTLREGERIEFAGIQFEVFDVPGHSPGHIMFVVREESPLVFDGDVIMAGSIGRTDFPGGSMEQLMTSIHSKVLVLPEESKLYPGHGPATTVGQEKKTNPFCRT